MLWQISGASMITWTIEALEYDDTDSNFPKRVTLIHVKGKHVDGPVFYTAWEVPPPTDPDYEYVRWEDITRDWAVQVWTSVDANRSASIEGYLNDLAAATDMGHGIPWE